MISFLARSRQTFFSIPFHLTVYSIVRYRRLLSLLRSVVKRLFRGRVILGRDGEREREIARDHPECGRRKRNKMESVQYFLPFPRFSLSFAFDSGEEQDTGEGIQGRGRERNVFKILILVLYIYIHIHTQIHSAPKFVYVYNKVTPFCGGKAKYLFDDRRGDVHLEKDTVLTIRNSKILLVK